jgi:hypothetical protein
MEMRMTMPMAVKRSELKGIFRLWRKLPSTISDAAQVVPMMDALIHFSLIWFLFNAFFSQAFLRQK